MVKPALRTKSIGFKVHEKGTRNWTRRRRRADGRSGVVPRGSAGESERPGRPLLLSTSQSNSAIRFNPE
jgi:hypothetical protein